MVKGKFNEFTGKLVMDDNTLKEATATIQVASIDTGVKQRDDHLRTPDFFDAKTHPTITFRTKRVEPTPEGFVMIADFTMRASQRSCDCP